jgi:hypothetical protein
MTDALEAEVAIGAKTSQSARRTRPALIRCRSRKTSLTIAQSVLAEMLAVPGHVLCSWEQEIVTGGKPQTGYASELRRDRADDCGVGDHWQVVPVLLEAAG